MFYCTFAMVDKQKKGEKLEKKTCLNTDISKPLQMNLK